MRSGFPHDFDEAHHTSFRRGDAFECESPVGPLEKLVPVVLISLAAIEAGSHDQIQVP